MTLTELENTIRLYVPGATSQVISSARLWDLINKGVRDVNEQLGVLQADTKFDITADKQEYTINTDIADDFVRMDVGGLWFYDGTQWNEVIPKTEKWVNEFARNWRSYSSSSKPLWYFIKPNKLFFVPAYNTTTSSGGWIYYIKTPQDLTGGDQYPWTASETDHFTQFDCLDDAIIAYAQWKLSQPLGQKANGIIDQAAYENRLAKCERIFMMQPDLSNDRYFRMRGPSGWTGSR